MHADLPGGGGRTALAALSWLVEAGCDTLVDDAPRSWLTVAPPSVAAPDHPLRERQDRSHQRRETGPSFRGEDDRATEGAGEPTTTAVAAAATLPALAAAIAALRDTPPLFADGDPTSGVMVVGEMPGAADIAAGRLFSGEPGVLLDRMLAAIKRNRTNTYLATAHYWPTPGGRAPEVAETLATMPLIRRHVALVRPRAVLALGATATAALLGTASGLGKLRGRWQKLDLDGVEVAVMPSFSPAYLLSHPAHKVLAWADLQAFQARISE